MSFAISGAPLAMKAPRRQLVRAGVKLAATRFVDELYALTLTDPYN
jgi:hypothetical protein